MPILVKTEKSKHKRLLRFLEGAFPLNAVMKAWLSFVIGCLWRKQNAKHVLLLIDETDLIAGWKAIVAAVPFRNRALPIFYLIYHDEQIRDLTYKSHNEIVQNFCVQPHELALTASGQQSLKPILVFDRGFARAKYVIKFLKAHNIGFVMRVCRNVGILYQGNSKKLDDLENGCYPDIRYHT